MKLSRSRILAQPVGGRAVSWTVTLTYRLSPRRSPWLMGMPSGPTALCELRGRGRLLLVVSSRAFFCFCFFCLCLFVSFCMLATALWVVLRVLGGLGMRGAHAAAAKETKAICLHIRTTRGRTRRLEKRCRKHRKSALQRDFEEAWACAALCRMSGTKFDFCLSGGCLPLRPPAGVGVGWGRAQGALPCS